MDLAIHTDDRAAGRGLKASARANAESGVRALARRGIDLSEALARWLDLLEAVETRRGPGGETLWRLAGGTWRGALAERAAVESAALPYTPTPAITDPNKVVKGIVVEGVSPPWLLIRVWRTTTATPFGFRPPIFVVQEDPLELIEGLACENLAELIADERVRFHVGPGAAALLRRHMERRIDCALPTEYLTSSGLRTKAMPGVVETVRALHALQSAEHNRLHALATAAYAGRAPAWWRRRYDDAAAGRGAPLRFLLPVSRFSTYVRHAAADIAEAFRRIGCEADVLTEPDDSSCLASPAYLRCFADGRIDGVALINYTRKHLPTAAPLNVPFLTLVQDRMPHLFHESVGKSLGPLDFLVGHLHREFFDLHGYPKARRRFWFVPASSAKFYRRDEAARSAHTPHAEDCDFAYVGHQSETPDAAHARLRVVFASHPVLLRVADGLYERMSADASRTGESFASPNRLILELAAKEGLWRTGEPDWRLVNDIAGAYAVPIAERLHRHAALGWAAEIAERRGWRFHVFGRGWEAHPLLSRFARGPVDHAEDLRRCYAAAKAHLHVSRNTNAHQRVYECALSGGLMLRRGPSPDAEIARWALVRWLFMNRKPALRTPWGDCCFDLVEGEFPDPALFTGLSMFPARARAPRTWRLRIHESWRRWMEERLPPYPLEMLPDQAFPFARETMFTSPAELEERLERAITDDAWRSRIVEAQADWAGRYATTERLAADVLNLIRDQLPNATA